MKCKGKRLRAERECEPGEVRVDFKENTVLELALEK